MRKMRPVDGHRWYNNRYLALLYAHICVEAQHIKREGWAKCASSILYYILLPQQVCVCVWNFGCAYRASPFLFAYTIAYAMMHARSSRVTLNDNVVLWM